MALKEQKKKLIDVPSTEDFRELEQDVAERQANAEERQRELSVIDYRYGSPDLPYNRDRVEGEILQIGQQIAWSFYEIGKRLILLKEHEQHGEFTAALERLGIVTRSARRWMQAAAVIERSKTVNLAVLPAQKLIELATLSDDELEELGEGGTVAGLQLDELDKMSFSELKAVIREHSRETTELKQNYEQVIEEKNKALNRLEKEARKKEEPDPKRVARKEAKLAQHACEGAIIGVRQAFKALRKELDELAGVPNLDFQDFLQRRAEVAELYASIGDEAYMTEEHLNNLVPAEEE